MASIKRTRREPGTAAPWSSDSDGSVPLFAPWSVVICVAMAAFVFVVWRRRLGMAVAVAGAVAGAVLLSAGLKTVIERPRPPHPPALVHPRGYAMPSTHAADTSAAAVAAWLSLTQLGRAARR